MYQIEWIEFCYWQRGDEKYRDTLNEWTVILTQTFFDH